MTPLRNASARGAKNGLAACPAESFDHTLGGYPTTVSSLHDAWQNAVDRLEKYGHPRIRAGAALFLLAACTIGFISVPILVAVTGAEKRSDYGAAVGGVIGAVFCVGMAVWMVSPRRGDRDDRGAAVLRFMDGRRWRALQVVSGAALVALGLLEVQRGNSEGWLMVAIAVVVVVVATQAFLYFARRRRTP
jgi:hypothetical protein